MRLSRILVLIAALSVASSVYAEVIRLAPQEIIEDYLDIADNYAFSGEYQKALEYIDMVVHFEPLNPTAKYKQAMLLTTLSKTDEAREIFAEAIRLNPKFANSELAAMLLENEPQKPVFEQSQQVEEISVKTTFDNNFGEAISQAKEPEPYSSEYYNQLGLQYMSESNNEKAYEYFKKAVELDKKNFDAYNNLGMFFWQQGENKLAQKTFKKAIYK